MPRTRNTAGPRATPATRSRRARAGGRPGPARPDGVELTCREFVEFLGEYFDSRLPADARTAFDDHLAECPDCVRYLRSYADTVRLAREACGAPEDPVPPDVPGDLVRAILAANAAPGRDR